VLVPPGYRGLDPRPAAVRVAELGGDTEPPVAAGAGGPQAAERFTLGWNAV
jgi:hypothetical protein